MYSNTHPHRLYVHHALTHMYLETHTQTHLQTHVRFSTHSSSIRWDVAARNFNVFTPPIERRVGPGMLIACGTMVGFYDDLRFPSRVVSYIGNNFISFQPTRIRTTRAVSCVLSARNTPWWLNNANEFRSSLFCRIKFEDFINFDEEHDILIMFNLQLHIYIHVH